MERLIRIINHGRGLGQVTMDASFWNIKEMNI